MSILKGNTIKAEYQKEHQVQDEIKKQLQCVQFPNNWWIKIKYSLQQKQRNQKTLLRVTEGWQLAETGKRHIPKLIKTYNSDKLYSNIYDRSDLPFNEDKSVNSKTLQ